jgi:hypothetical protein
MKKNLLMTVIKDEKRSLIYSVLIIGALLMSITGCKQYLIL